MSQKDKSDIDEKEKPFRERMKYENPNPGPIQYRPINYDSVKLMILKGLNINEMCDPENVSEKKKLLKIMRELEIVANNSKRAADGSVIPDEELVQLLKLVQRDPSLTITKVMGSLDRSKCLNGKINNIINNVFNGNRYTAYYVLRRMKSDITLDKNYDKKIYDSMREETSSVLEKIVLPLKKIEVLKGFKTLDSK